MLTYDDAPASQLDHAVPVLDSVEFEGTFFITGLRPAVVPRWRAVAANGHDLANHTLFHACPGSKWSTDPRNTSETYTPEAC